MMKEEGIQEGGHLQINRNIILWLTDLHNQLLQSSKFPFYTAAYYKALPYIVELRNKGGDKKGRVGIGKLFRCPLRRDVAPPATQTDKRQRPPRPWPTSPNFWPCCQTITSRTRQAN